MQHRWRHTTTCCTTANTALQRTSQSKQLCMQYRTRCTTGKKAIKQRTSCLVVATSEVALDVLAVIEQVVLAPGNAVVWLLDVAAALRLVEQERVADELAVRPRPRLRNGT